MWTTVRTDGFENGSSSKVAIHVVGGNVALTPSLIKLVLHERDKYCLSGTNLGRACASKRAFNAF